jgi:hypothetical protein
VRVDPNFGTLVLSPSATDSVPTKAMETSNPGTTVFTALVLWYPKGGKQTSHLSTHLRVFLCTLNSHYLLSVTFG